MTAQEPVPSAGEYEVTRVASMSMTTQPVSALPAMTSHGNPAVVPSISVPHVRAGLRAGAGDPVQHGRAAGQIQGAAHRRPARRGRPAPGPGAPAPRYRSCWWPPARSRPPSRPARSPGRTAASVPFFRSAAPSQPVSPAWSAALRSRTAPACPTRPVPSRGDLQGMVPPVMRRVAPGGFPAGAPSEPCVPVDPAHGSSKPRGRFRIGAVVPGSCAGGRRARAGRRRGRGVSVHRPAGWACRGR